MAWVPQANNLNDLHRVEGRLTQSQLRRYVDELCGRSPHKIRDMQQFDYADAWSLIHAAPERKIRALAAAITVGASA